MKCEICGSENEDSVAVCAVCGAPISRICANCGAPLAASDCFCRVCGQPVPTSDEDEVRLARLNSCAPSDLVEKIQSSSATTDRKLVTALFATVTYGSEPPPPDAWLAIRESAFEQLVPRIHRYEGTLAQLIGDGLLAFFGAPLIHEDDPRRAVYAAQEMLDDARRLYGLDLIVRIGVHTGLAVVGKADADLKYVYSAVGDTVNLAVRLQAAAAPMTALVSSDIYRYTQPFFDYATRDIGSVRCYEVIRSRSGNIQGRGVAGLESVFVGRDAELARLQPLTSAVQAGLGRAVLILGEPGLGKSRLLSEWGAAQNLNRVEGQCQSFTQSFPYQLIAILLRALLKLDESDGLPALQAAVEALLGQRAVDVFPYLAHLLGIGLQDEALMRIQDFDPQSLAMQYADAFRKVLTVSAARAPLAVVCEDIHWADPSSVALLERIVPVIPVTRVLFCFTSRPERNAPGWRLITTLREALGEALTEIPLRPLSDADSHQLLSTLLSANALSEQVLSAVRAKAEGNPFFVEELVRTLIEDGSIRREGDRWISVRGFNSAHVPDNLTGLLLARIDHQPDENKRTLRIASVIGRQFSVRVVQHVLAVDDSAALLPRLSALEAANLIQLAQVEPELEYRFRHALLQEASYNSLQPEDCRQLHLAVGRALEALYPERLHELAAALGHHFMEAGENGEAKKYFLLAGGYAERKYANVEAITHYSHVLELIDVADGDRFRVLRQRGALYERVGDFDAARSDYEAALSHAEQTGDQRAQWQALIDLGHLWASHDYVRTGAYYQRAYDLAQRLEDTQLVASALNWLGNWHVNREEPNLGQQLHKQALQLFEEIGDQHGILETVDLLTMSQVLGGDAVAGMDSAERTITLAEALDAQSLLATALIFKAAGIVFSETLLSVPALPFGERVALVERGLHIVRSIGSRSQESFICTFAALLSGRSGDYAGGLKRAEEALTIAREIDHHQWQIHASNAFVQIYVDMCAPERARTLAETALELAQQINSIYWQRQTTALLALACIDLGDLVRAEALLNAIVDFSSPPNSFGMRSVWMARIRLELARERYETVMDLLDVMLASTPSLDERGEHSIIFSSYARGKALTGLMRVGKASPTEVAQRAEQALRAAQLLLEAHHLHTTLWRVHIALGDLYRFLLRSDEAEQEFASARALVDELAASAPNEELRAQFLRGAAEAWAHLRADLTQRVIKGYQIREIISSGGFGVVYRAYQPVVDREVAIKVILPQYANQAEFVQRFEAEAHLVARLEHPHIVPLYDYWRDADGAFLVMRFIRGGSLRDALANGALPIPFVVMLVEQIASALASAHRQGVIHRDIKPDNILLDEDGNAYLTDFGIAKISGHAADEGIAGSLSYLSPEQITGQSLGAQTDVYGLGVVLFEALAGQHPFAEATPSELIFHHLHQPLPDLRTLHPDFPAAVNEIVQKATQKDPSQRYVTAPDLAQAFRFAALSSSDTIAPVSLDNNPLLTRWVIKDQTRRDGTPDKDDTQLARPPG